MIVGSLLKIAASSLFANKLRSSLTLLGVIFGVTSVMTIISALEGMMGAIEDDLDNLGPTTFFVQRIGTAMSEEEFLEKLKRKPIKLESAELIRKGATLVTAVTPRMFGRARVKAGDRALRRVSIRGAEANIADMVSIKVAAGRFHSVEDGVMRRRVAFIGSKLREELFDDHVDPIGQRIKLNGIAYTVIGVAEARGSAFGGDNQDLYVELPLRTYFKQFGANRFSYPLVMKARSVEELDQAMDEVRVILRAQRHVPYNEPDDFDLLTADDILQLINTSTQIIRLALVGISSISLVVGGIVVMNIMMVSVSERTREIGIRKAIGAKQGHIRTQFLFESLMLTLGGGMIGIFAGYMAAKLLIAQIGMDISPSAIAIFAGLFISTSTGLFFGIYPAVRAARLDPVKALSYE